MAESKPKIYVTGKVKGHTKDVVQAVVEEYGYQWSSSVSKNLSLLITGKKPGPKKIEKAKALGIRLMSWEEFVTTSK
ncbi:MAG: BRCT domain-containing protein [Candidatus Hodarchaeales archaeon]|jgi:DNA ligase (NAD+)